MGKLSDEIAAYEGMRDLLETDHPGEWAVVHDGKLHGTYKDPQEAANEAVAQFGRGPYLIRQIGAAPPALPASVMYRPVHAVA